MKRRLLSVILTVIISLSPCAVVGYAVGGRNIRIVVPEEWEMNIGDSRSVECVFSEGIENRVLQWSVTPESVAVVDEWGRVAAVSEGKATVTAKTSDGLSSSVELTVTDKELSLGTNKTKVDYTGKAAEYDGSTQKKVSRYKTGSSEIPTFITECDSYQSAQKATTADGAVWEITDYGVLRTFKKAKNERDIEQRFMGDRYFYSADSTDGNVIAIFPDGENGIWTVMKEGCTHIELVEISGEDKAAEMSETTQKYVSRHGLVNESYYWGNSWHSAVSENDGLWTSMYGAGELMRYAVLRDDPSASDEEIEQARKAAYSSTEAVLLLTYISMRQGTVETTVKAQRNGSIVDPDTGKWYSSSALIKDGDYSANIPEKSPASAFDDMYGNYMKTGKASYLMTDSNLSLFSPESWSDPSENSDVEYATQTRSLSGFLARSFVVNGEDLRYMYKPCYNIGNDGTAVCFTPNNIEYITNGEDLRGTTVDASAEVPQRLWDDVLGAGYDADDLIYVGDTSSDEIIGHLFIYKLAFDILGEEDPEMANMIAVTMDTFAKHLVANGYALCDASGQPTTWGKFGRTYLHNGQMLGGAPLNAAVLLSAFKLAAYVTGEKKWENEYRMIAMDPAYEYAKLTSQEYERYTMSILEYINSVSPIIGFFARFLTGTKLFNFVYRLILNHSDEEMAMLAYYLLFQLEDDETLLEYYREGLDDWWISISMSENPLWYCIYQLAYPDKAMTDSYGNNIVELASWSLSRHPIDTRMYLASNPNRDDTATLDLTDYGISNTNVLTYDPNYVKPWFADSESKELRIFGLVLSSYFIKWKVAAPDERMLHKYNTSSYRLGTETKQNVMNDSTTFTLPYWMGRYHGILK